MRLSAIIVASGLVAASAAGAAETQSARYGIAIAGFNIGSITLTVTRDGKGYVGKLNGSYGFLGNRGSFSGTSTGVISDKGATPASFVQTMKGKDDETTRIAFKGGNVTKTVVTPEPKKPEPKDRIPLGADDLKGVIDPIAAVIALSMQAGKAEAAVCAGTVPVFTGQVRAEIDLAPGTVTPIQILCKARFRPIAGHRPTSAVKRIASSDALRIGFSQKQDGDFRFLHSLSIPLRVGTLTITRRD